MVGRVLSDRYRIDALVATGSFGAVYRGVHLHMLKQVAIKVLHPEVENFPDLVERFQREAIAGAHITHPNVAVASDLGKFDGDSYFLVQEYVHGQTLREAIDQGALPPIRVAYIARQIAAGLGAAHQHNIVHRDLKASNIMLLEGAKDFVKIIDFGFARVPFGDLPHRPEGTDDTEWLLSESGVVFGTPAYMAPEAALGMKNVDQRSDLYALGILCYEMLTGKHPFDDSLPGPELFVQQRDLAPPPMSERNPDVEPPPALEALVMRLLSKSPDDRPATASEVIGEIDTAMRGVKGYLNRRRSDRSPAPSESSSSDVPSPIPVVAPRERPSIEPTVGRRVVIVAGLVAVAAVLVIVSSRLWGKSESGNSAMASAATAQPTAPPPAASSTRRSESFDQRYRRKLRAELVSKAEHGNVEQAANALLGLVQDDPKPLEDAKTQSAASALAKRMPADDDATKKVFYALAYRTGSAGLDVLYRVLDESPIGSPPAQRAESILAVLVPSKRTSNELRIAWELRRSACDQRPILFDRASKEGDARTARLLEAMNAPDCKRALGQCCLRGDFKLKKALARLEDRLNKEH